MSAEIVKPFGIAPPDGKPVEIVVEKLQNLLEMAQRGEITGFLGVVVYAHDGTQTVSALGTAGAFDMLAGLRLAERDFIDKNWPANG